MKVGRKAVRKLFKLSLFLIFISENFTIFQFQKENKEREERK